jgi:hypothetical protein
MANINRKSQASFRWMLSCATIGIAVMVSPCFAQGDRDASQEAQRLQEVQRLLGPCDSLDPKVCFDIYQRRMEQLPERTPDLGWLSREYGQAMFGKSLPGVRLPFGELQPGGTWMGPPFRPSFQRVLRLH